MNPQMLNELKKTPKSSLCVHACILLLKILLFNFPYVCLSFADGTYVGVLYHIMQILNFLSYEQISVSLG